MNNRNFSKYIKILTEKAYENINESQTIDWLIAPMLRDMFEWDREDPEEVRPQWRKLTDGEKENPVDFALFISSQTKPIALVEAKRLNEKLIGKPVSQAIAYCISANVRWAILTNGLEWKVYDALDLSKDELTDRLLFQVNMLDFLTEKSGINNLDLISKSKIESLEQIISLAKMKDVIESFFDLTNLKSLSIISEIISSQTKYKADSIRELLKEYTVKLIPNTALTSNWKQVTQDLDFNQKISFIKIRTSTQEVKFQFKSWANFFEESVSFLFENYDKLQILYTQESLKSYISIDKKTLQKDYVLENSIKPIKNGFLSTHSSTQTKIKILLLFKDYLLKNNEYLDILYLE